MHQSNEIRALKVLLIDFREKNWNHRHLLDLHFNDSFIESYWLHKTFRNIDLLA